MSNNRRDVPGDSLQGISTSRLGRGLKVLSILNEGFGVGRVKRQARELLDKAGLGEVGQGELARELGQNLARSMGEMKGIVMKVGQMLSYLDNQLPPEARAALSQLQTRMAPVETSRMKEVFRAEFGIPVAEAFAQFDDVPVAAASLGQVYRATLHDGREVAIKIQYPEIVTAVRNDLKNVGLMSQVAAVLNTSVTDVIEELTETLGAELDYVQEANNIRKFAAIYAGDPVVVVPTLVEQWSGRTVLTTVFEEGLSFQQMLDTFGPEQRFVVSRAVGRFFYVSFYFYGMFNADPHPGNYIFRPDGKVVFLDYGCVRHFNRDFLDRQIHFTEVLRTGNPRDFQQALIHMGIVPEANVARVDWGLLTRFFRRVYEPIIVDTPFTYSEGYNREVSELSYTLQKSMFMTLRMPREFVFLNRITFGLNAIHARLGLSLNYYRPATTMFNFYHRELSGQPIIDPRVRHINYEALDIRYEVRGGQPGPTDDSP